MPYVTTLASIRYHQMTLDEILDAPAGAQPRPPVGKPGDTRTVFYERTPPRLRNPVFLMNCAVACRDFVKRWDALYQVPRQELYRTFYVPKSSRGYRRIDAPNGELKEALRELKGIFEQYFYASHHTSAFAYAKKRCNIDAVKKHQANQSRWFFKTDCSDFFGSTTYDFTVRMLSQVWPFSEILDGHEGKEYLLKALDLAFLNGGLPQGTPLSPLLTNLVMIPIDHELMNRLRDFNGQSYVYTRYADDIGISARKNFCFTDIMNLMKETFVKFGAPYEIKREKTHYGSSNGRNWFLGVMYNKDCAITIGNRRKKEFRAQLTDYLRSRKSGNPWDYKSVQQLQGVIAYYRKVEPEYVAGVLEHHGKRHEINVMQAIREDLRG